MYNPIETKEHEKATIKIYTDDDPHEGPRDWDNLGTMLCFHGRYNLGDSDAQDDLNERYDSDDFEDWDAMEQALIKQEDIAVILPLYLFDHSGITIRTGPFSCPWDSGQVGFVFVTKDKLRKEFNRKRLSTKILTKAEGILCSEVKVYDQYLTGDIYGFVIEDKSGEQVDSCWGFYGMELVLQEAYNVIKHYDEKARCSSCGEEPSNREAANFHNGEYYCGDCLDVAQSTKHCSCCGAEKQAR